MKFREYVKFLGASGNIVPRANGTAVSYDFQFSNLKFTCTYDEVYEDVRPIVNSQVLFASGNHPDPLEYNRHCLRFLAVQLLPVEESYFKLQWKVPLDSVPEQQWVHRISLFVNMTQQAHQFLNPPKILADTYRQYL